MMDEFMDRHGIPEDWQLWAKWRVFDVVYNPWLPAPYRMDLDDAYRDFADRLVMVGLLAMARVNAKRTAAGEPPIDAGGTGRLC